MGKVRKIAIMILLLFSICLRALCPQSATGTIISGEVITPYRDLIRAIGIVETSLDTMSYNPVEQAVGYFQIRPIRLEDYNRRTGSSYKLEDMFNYQAAEKIFIYYAEQLGPYHIEQIARSWNGSGDKTIEYWKKVKNQLIGL